MTKPRRSPGPDPENYAVSGTEDAECIALMMWAALPDNQEKYPELKWLTHIPNGGRGVHTKIGGTRLKAMGVKAGVPDYFLAIRRGSWPGLLFEMKRKKSNKGPKKKAQGKTSDAQDMWFAHLQSQGYGTAVCYGWHEARDLVIAYLGWKP